MKKLIKIITFIICMFIYTNNVYAEKIEVKLKTCIDGDTAIFKYKKESFKARFLAIDTPETEYSEKGEQPYDKEASEYTCNKLKKAKKIKLEYDDNSTKTDKYDRHLVWVWIDDKLLQTELIRNGYAKISYLYDNYKYTEILKKEEEIAKEKELNIWKKDKVKEENNNNNNNNKSIDIPVIGIIIIFIILLIKKLVKSK